MTENLVEQLKVKVVKAVSLNAYPQGEVRDINNAIDEFSGGLATQLQELLDARPELTTSIEPFNADWMDHKSHLKLALENNHDFIKWYNTMKSAVLGLLGAKESKTQ